MVDRRQFTEFISGKLWNLLRNFRLTLIFYICVFKLRFAESSETLKGLDQNPFNPGPGVNYYPKQKTEEKTLLSGTTILHLGDDFEPRDCSKAPKNTSCIQRDKFFQSPSLRYLLKHPAVCDFTNPYRHFNGICNNPGITRLGMADDCYFRFTPPYYNGFGGFRTDGNGNPLLNTREISLSIFNDRHRSEVKVSFQFLTFGQLIAHDMSRAVQPQTDCCSSANAQKEECAPISVRADDPFYSKFNQNCIDFKRSDKCTLGKTENREQKNGATAALDCSIVYGVSEDRAKELRALDGTGTLKFTNTDTSSYLPTGKDPGDLFCPKEQESKCYKSGDPRTNQHATLTFLQTVLMREHNRIARELKKINPNWDEEKLFQESRKIVIAEFQCIVYQDFLPILLTPRIMKEFDITIEKGSVGSIFSPVAALAVWQEWAHAAFRLHSGVPTDIGSMNLQFKETFSNPDLIKNGHGPDLIKGSQKVPNEKLDSYMIVDLTNHLYEKPGKLFGKDLAAFNIKRGRDHGIAPYIEIVLFCTERTVNITSFKDLIEYRIMPTKNVRLLENNYESVGDVDMWVGMQLEKHMPGSILGPSATCVNAKQFYFTQKADRFFFNHEGPFGPFTSDQRSTIKNTSLGRILCDNIDIKEISKNTFLLPSRNNPVVSCNQIPKVDLSFWKETKSLFSLL